MKPEYGQHVKCFMRSSTVLEGKVEEWTDAQVVLQSLDGKSFLIVHNPGADIMLTKVVLEPPVSEEIPEEKPKRPLNELQQEVRKKLHEVREQAEDADLQAKSLTELRQMVHEQEKQIIALKRKEHFGSSQSPKLTRYSQPSFREAKAKLPPWVK